MLVILEVYKYLWLNLASCVSADFLTFLYISVTLTFVSFPPWYCYIFATIRYGLRHLCLVNIQMKMTINSSLSFLQMMCHRRSLHDCMLDWHGLPFNIRFGVRIWNGKLKLGLAAVYCAWYPVLKIAELFHVFWEPNTVEKYTKKGLACLSHRRIGPVPKMDRIWDKRRTRLTVEVYVAVPLG